MSQNDNRNNADYPRLPAEVLVLLGQINCILSSDLSQLVSFTVIHPEGLITHLLAAFEEGVQKPQYARVKESYVRHIRNHADGIEAGDSSIGPSCKGVEIIDDDSIGEGENYPHEYN